MKIDIDGLGIETESKGGPFMDQEITDKDFQIFKMTLEDFKVMTMTLADSFQHRTNGFRVNYKDRFKVLLKILGEEKCS